MLRIAGHLLSLVAAVALTSSATAALIAAGTPRGITCGGFMPPLYFSTALGPVVPPPLPRFIRPSVGGVGAPEILCEVPGDPGAVTQDCGLAAFRRNAI